MTYQSSAALAESESAAHEINPTIHPTYDSLPATAWRILDEVRDALPHDLATARSSAARLALLLRESVALPPAQPGPNKGGLAPWQEHKVHHYIDSNLENPIWVDDLADLVKLSTSHFCRAFKTSFSASPHAYIVQQRVQRAQEIMSTTGSPLSQIALDCGFADQAHLSRVFRRLTGLTPNAWRRACAQGALRAAGCNLSMSG